MAYQSRLVTWLDALLLERKVAEGFDFLRQQDAAVGDLKPTEPDAGPIAVRLAQWVDLGYRNVEFLEAITERFSLKHRSRMRVAEFLQLRMAEAFCALGEENLDRAIEILEFVLQAEGELADKRLAAIAHFWKGRAHRKKGEYVLAKKHIETGRGLMQVVRADRLAAVIQIQESWLLFQTGQLAEAQRVLDEAKAQLADTDDALSLGNIESARGRMERQAGKYTEA